MVSEKSALKKIWKNRILFLMIFPTALYVFIFSYIPMGGIIVAFKDYNVVKGLFDSEWIGWLNFKLFFSSGKMVRLTLNTLTYNILFIVIGTFFEIFFAILISEMCTKRYKRTLQSIMMFPHFISWVIAGGMLYNILNYEFGALNQLLASMGFERVDVYRMEWVWKPILTMCRVWSGTGYGMIFYMAAISGINTELYDAARVDGCGIIQRICHIMLPLLRPTISIMLIMSLGGILKGNNDMFYNIIGQNPLLYDSTDVIDTYVYRALTEMQDYGVTSAAGLYQSVVGFALVLVVNMVVKRMDKDSALF